MLRSRGVLLGLLVAAMGCGTTVDAPANANAGSAGEGGSGPSPDTAGEGGGGSGAGGGGSGGVIECSQYLDAPSQGEVQFIVTNHRATELDLRGGPCNERFRITQSGESKIAELTQWTGALTCAGFQMHADCPYECDLGPGSIPIAPGGVTTMQWSGLLYDFVQMPLSCAADPTIRCASQCLRGAPPSASMLEVELSVQDASRGSTETIKQAFSYPPVGPVAVSIDP